MCADTMLKVYIGTSVILLFPSSGSSIAVSDLLLSPSRASAVLVCGDGRSEMRAREDLYEGLPKLSEKMRAAELWLYQTTNQCQSAV